MMSFLEKLGVSLPALPSSPPTHDPQKSTLLQLAAIIGIAVIMHFQIADKRIAVFAALVFGLKVGLILKGKKAPNRVAMMLLTISSLGLIVASYGGWNGQTAGISFLVLLVTLKFLESRGLRDYFVVCLILYFLAASSFLFDSSILSICIVVGYTLVITSILFQLSNPTHLAWYQVYKSSVALVAKAVPLAILLFFFFPRIQGDFGFLPSQDQFDSDSELSNRLIAGEMAASAFNDELAFRVDFDGNIPQTQNLYWRAKVMTAERNFQWEVVDPRDRPPVRSDELRDKMDLNAGEIKYQILHEKSTDLFLPYLDYVAGAEIGNVLHDYTVFQAKSRRTDFRYQGSSNLIPFTITEDPAYLNSLTKNQNPPSARIQALLTRWRSQANSDAELARLVFQYFQTNPFSYSLTPDGLDEINPLEDFLFNTQTGYCEHYASAYTTLMRWLEVPARVVAGYQGGRPINNGGFLEVRYSDAHAWSEVWIDGQWQRIDPTTAVSPERIEFGMDAFRELWQSGNINGQGLADFLNPTGSARILRSIRDTWSNITYQWNKWVVDYDFETQKELLSKLGLENKKSAYTLVALMIAGVGSLLLFYFWQLIPRRIKRTEIQTLYLRFVAKLKKATLKKHLSESPREFAARAAKELPHQASMIEQITQQYEQLRYGKDEVNSHKEFQRFKQAVKGFKLQ